MMFLSLLMVDFRNCDQLRFCNENIKAQHPQLSIKKESLVFEDNLFSSDLFIGDEEANLTVSIYKIANSGFRFRVDPEEKLSKYRFDITTDDIIVNKTKLTERSKLEIIKNDAFCKLIDKETKESCAISYNPFSVTFSRDGEEFILLNSENFLYVENGDPVDNARVKTVNSVFNKKFDVDAEETTKHGKTGVGIDISYLSIDTRLSGFSEGQYPINLEDTNGVPERRYARDGYTKYGFVPLLTGHSSNFRITPTVFWMNPSDMFIDIKTTSNARVVKFLAEGGFIDLVIFLAEMPTVLKEYTHLTGTAPLPPLFSLGYHQSKFGYESQEKVEEVIDGLNNVSFPLDVMWLDIDYLYDHAPFDINYTWFPDPQRLYTKLSKDGRYFVRITDPHLPTNINHTQYNEAHTLDYFEKNASNQEAHATCWPGESAWPDFFRKDVRTWWAKQFHYEADPKGWAKNVYLWNDMNEISAFDQVEGTAGKDWLHFNGTIEERETHSAYGLMMTAASYQGLLERDNYTLRPFILTRSFFAGSQKYAFHWSGDNDPSWEHLRLSIELALTSGINGVPYTGSDIGGYFGDCTDELYARWFQASAFIYPFFRQHTTDESHHREPYLYNGTKPEIFKAMLQATEDRYQLLALWYTAAYHNSISGAPLVSPLWYDFPEVDELHDVRYQAIIDHRVMAAPALYEGQTNVSVTKPPGKWYQFKTGKELLQSQEINVTLADTPVYVRGGTITPVFIKPRQSTKEQVKEDIGLLIALDENGKAEGDIYLDDGTTFNYTTKHIYTTFKYDNGHFIINSTGSCDEVNNTISEFLIYGISEEDAKNVQTGGVHKYRNNTLLITKLSYNVKKSYESVSSSLNFNLWIIAVSICSIMAVIIIVFGIFICRLQKNSGYEQINVRGISYTESVDGNQKDVTKSVV